MLAIFKIRDILNIHGKGDGKLYVVGPSQAKNQCHAILRKTS